MWAGACIFAKKWLWPVESRLVENATFLNIQRACEGLESPSSSVCYLSKDSNWSLCIDINFGSPHRPGKAVIALKVCFFRDVPAISTSVRVRPPPPNFFSFIYFMPLHPYTHRTQRFRLGALVWQPQPSFSISDRSCLMAGSVVDFGGRWAVDISWAWLL